MSLFHWPGVYVNITLNWNISPIWHIKIWRRLENKPVEKLKSGSLTLWIRILLGGSCPRIETNFTGFCAIGVRVLILVALALLVSDILLLTLTDTQTYEYGYIESPLDADQENIFFLSFFWRCLRLLVAYIITNPIYPFT